MPDKKTTDYKKETWIQAPRTSYKPEGGWVKVPTFEAIKQRDLTFDYKPLNEVLTKEAFAYTGIAIPELTRSRVVEVHSISAKGPLFFHENDPRPIVSFKVEGHPYENEEGKKAIKKAFTLVQDVLKKDYKPEVAIIYQTGKGEQKGEERQIHDCLITGMELNLGKKETVKLVFHLLGLLHRPY